MSHKTYVDRCWIAGFLLTILMLIVAGLMSCNKVDVPNGATAKPSTEPVPIHAGPFTNGPVVGTARFVGYLDNCRLFVIEDVPYGGTTERRYVTTCHG